jgi:hypothetical protein
MKMTWFTEVAEPVETAMVASAVAVPLVPVAVAVYVVVVDGVTACVPPVGLRV